MNSSRGTRRDPAAICLAFATTRSSRSSRSRSSSSRSTIASSRARRPMRVSRRSARASSISRGMRRTWRRCSDNASRSSAAGIIHADLAVALAPGARLGPYEIVAPLGAGGMGEVYRARDTKLNREVAIKVLLTTVANDPDRLARFSREAQVLAALNHPNIAHIHGLEDSADAPALVMELVEGPTLADRIAQGAIPVADALPIAR